MKTVFESIPGRIDNGVDATWQRRRTTKLMTIRLAAIVIGVVLGVCSAKMYGQIKMKFIANAATAGPAPAACRQEAEIVHSIITEYKHRDSWTWIVACDESSWRILSDHLGLVSPAREYFAATDLRYRVTYVRGYTLLHPLRDYPTVPVNVIVHELVHADMNSSDEDMVERTAQSWIKDHQKTLIASAR